MDGSEDPDPSAAAAAAAHRRSASVDSGFQLPCFRRVDGSDGEEEPEAEEEEMREEAVYGSHIRRYQRRLSFREVRHFPPPIPLLAQTGNLPSHMPWLLKRCTTGGRLVIREVKLKHHEFFRAHRSNGRLTLRLVHFEDSSAAAPQPEAPLEADIRPPPPENEAKTAPPAVPIAGSCCANPLVQLPLPTIRPVLS